MQNCFKGLFSLVFLGAVSLSSAVAGSTDISLYTQPNAKSRLVGTRPYSTRFVPIYEQGDWLKVGDPTNGAVGWINKTQYMNALQDAAKAHTQTFVFEEKNQVGKPPVIRTYHDGKRLTKPFSGPLSDKVSSAGSSSTANPSFRSDDIVVRYSHQPGEKQPTIIAYENGKQLSPQASKAILARMHVEGAAMQRHFNQVQQNIQKMFRRSMEDFQQVEDDVALPSQPMLIPLEPGLVIPETNSSPQALQSARAENHSLLASPLDGIS